MEHTTDEQAATSSSARAEWPEPQADIRVTNLLIVRDIARSRHFYADILGAQVLREGLVGPPAILRFHNTWLVLSTEGGPTDDKPDVFAVAPRDSKTLSTALNLRVTNIHELYERWRALGAEFLTPPKDHEAEIRCYMRDPDWHLIEVGQAKPGAMTPTE